MSALLRQGVGGGGRPHRMHADARDDVDQAERAGIAPHDVLIDGDGMQGFGEGPGAVVLDGPE